MRLDLMLPPLDQPAERPVPGLALLALRAGPGRRRRPALDRQRRLVARHRSDVRAAWPLGVPLALLVPAAILWHRRSLRTLLFSVVLLVWPIMGLCLPWRTWLADEPSGPHVRLLTCNIHYQQLHPEALRGVIHDARPDVVALQYWTSRFEKDVFKPEDWNTHREGQFYLATHYSIRATAKLGDPIYAVRV